MIMTVKKHFKIQVFGNKQTVCVHTGGSGTQLILFIHGWIHSGEVWKYVMNSLSESYKVAALDLPGFGDSPPFEQDKINIKNYSELLSNLLKENHLNSSPHMIVGDSLGGIVALHLVNQTKEITNRLLMSGCPVNGLPRLLHFFKNNKLISSSLNSIKYIPPSISSIVIKYLSLFTVNRLKNVDRSIIEGVKKADPLTAELIFQELCSPVKNDLIKIDKEIKTAVVRGEKDRVVSKESAMRLINETNAQYIEIKNTGHTPMLEAVRQYVEAIMSII